MRTIGYSAPVVRLQDQHLRYGKTIALGGLTVDIPAGCMVGLITFIVSDADAFMTSSNVAMNGGQPMY